MGYNSRHMDAKTIKRYRSNLIQSPENLPPRKKKMAEGTLDMEQPLTEMQRQFVTYVVDHQMTQTAAARAAGSSEPGAAGVMWSQHPRVQRAIELRRAEYAAASQITKKKVIDGFLEAIEMAKTKADPLTMIAGWREVGKMCGLYEATKTKVELSVGGQVLIQRMNSMSDEELLQLANEDLNVIDMEPVDDKQSNSEGTSG